jgi:hypothetical protein
MNAITTPPWFPAFPGGQRTARANLGQHSGIAGRAGSRVNAGAAEARGPVVEEVRENDPSIGV